MEYEKCIVRYLSGNASEEEVKALELWRKIPGNEEIFRELERTWKFLSGQGSDPDFNKEKAFEAFLTRTHVSTPAVKKQNVPIVLIGGGIAACFLLFFAIALRSSSAPGTFGTYAGHSDPVTILWAGDSVREICLSDSSYISLNKKSRLFIRQDFQTHRRVGLAGEGFFHVHHDSLLPFSVHTSSCVIRVLGTSFHVIAYDPALTEVSVMSGKVEFSTTGRPTEKKWVLSTGEKISYDTRTYTAAMGHFEKDTNWWRSIPIQFKRFIKNTFATGKRPGRKEGNL